MPQTSKPIVPQGPLTFEELRLASKLHKVPAKQAITQLMELAQNLVPPQTLERFSDGEAIEAQTRLIRQHKDGHELLARTLADMVIQIDRFAALNSIDLEASIRKRFEPAQETPHDLERKRPGD